MPSRLLAGSYSAREDARFRSGAGWDMERGWTERIMNVFFFSPRECGGLLCVAGSLRVSYTYTKITPSLFLCVCIYIYICVCVCVYVYVSSMPASRTDRAVWTHLTRVRLVYPPFANGAERRSRTRTRRRQSFRSDGRVFQHRFRTEISISIVTAGITILTKMRREWRCRQQVL